MKTWEGFFNNKNIKKDLELIDNFIKQEEIKYEPLKVFPKENLFKCFELTSFDKMRVVFNWYGSIY